MAAPRVAHGTAHSTAASSTSSPAGGLVALAQKLRHPLGRIRARALANLLFKLREGLVDVSIEPQHAVDELAAALVPCLGDSELEVSALQVMQLVMDASACSLRRHGAATALQQGATRGSRPDLRASYESLLQRLLSTTTAGDAEQTPSESIAVTETTDHHPRVSPAVRSSVATEAVASRRIARGKAPGDALTRGGWRLPPVQLAIADEQMLFEFEVKWRLRTAIPDIVAMCDDFRCRLLRDFPPQVFLQRPTVLERVLELVRQPIVPAATTPELSFGVNYFDEPTTSTSFIWKPSVRATALHVSALKALEAWLSAMRYELRIALNPVYNVFPSASTSQEVVGVSAGGFDHRRLHYPRTIEEHDRGDDEEGALSLGGSAYLICSTLLQLLSSEVYPEVHILNIVSATKCLMRERRLRPDEAASSVDQLDKVRIEALFALIEEKCCSPVHKPPNALIQQQVLEWFLSTFELYAPASFTLGDEESGGAKSKIQVSSVLWKWILDKVAVLEYDDKPAILQLLDQVDPTAAASVRQEVTTRNVHEEVMSLLGSCSKGEDMSSRSLDAAIARRLVRLFPRLQIDQREAACQLVLQTLIKNLDDDSTGQCGNHVDSLLVDVLHVALRDSQPKCQELAVDIVDGLFNWCVDDTNEVTTVQRVECLVSAVAQSDQFMHGLLTYLAGASAKSFCTESLWRIAELLVRAFERLSTDVEHAPLIVKALRSSVPVMQHFAYSDEKMLQGVDPHKHLQRSFAAIVHRLEVALTENERLLLISRCLLHQSAYIRKAAARGLLDRLLALDMSPNCNAVVAADPFGQFAGGQNGGQRRILDDEIPAVLQPTREVKLRNENGDSDPTGRAINRVAKLRKVLASTITSGYEGSVATVSATLQQLLIDLVQVSSIDFTLLNDSGELDALIDSIYRMLHDSSFDGQLRRVLLSIIRVVLTRSLGWRNRIRLGESEKLASIISFTFDEDPRVRAEIYFTVVALTCSTEVVVQNPPQTIGIELVAEFASTFGLFSGRWSLCGFSSRSISDLAISSTDGRLEEDYKGVIELNSNTSKDTDIFASVWEPAMHAKSYRAFLDALYGLTHACIANTNIREAVASKCNQSLLQKYLETPPTSAKDRVVMAACISLVNTVFSVMSRNDQVDVVLLLRRAVIPLVMASNHQSGSLTTQLVRMLLQISESSASDMFLPLAIDTGLTKTLGESLVVSGVVTSSPLLRSLWLDVALRAMQVANTNQREQINMSIGTSLVSIVTRLRVPGSFQDRDTFVRAVECLTIGGACGAPDAQFGTRLLFDSSSTLRSVGFRVVGKQMPIEAPDIASRTLRLAVDTLFDDAESDAVRASAAGVVFELFQHALGEGSSLTASIEATTLFSDLKCSIAKGLQSENKCSVRSTLAQIQLLQLFITSNQAKLNVDGLMDRGPDIYATLRALVEAMSLRRWMEKYRRHCALYLGLGTTDDLVWAHSILPTVLKTIAEIARLFEIVLMQSSATKEIITMTPVVAQLSESIIDLSKSLDPISEVRNDGLSQHEEALDQLVRLLALLLAKIPSTRVPSSDAPALVESISILISQARPKSFRLSISRLIAVVMTRSSETMKSEIIESPRAVSIGDSLWSLYCDLSGQQPMDPHVTTQNTGIYVNQKRVAFVLSSLVAESPRVSSHLVSDQLQAVQQLVRMIKMCFTAIRMTGGFGAKTAVNKLSGSNEHFALDLSNSVHLHLVVLSAFLASSPKAQDIARQEKIPALMSENWNTMRTAYSRSCQILTGAIRLLRNYVHENESNKGSLVTSGGSSTPSASSTDNDLLSLLGDLAVSALGGDLISTTNNPSWCSEASRVLKAALLHSECLHGAIKTNLVTRFFTRVVEVCKRQRQTSRALQPQQADGLVQLFGVLASVATSDEGRQVILPLRELRNLMDDILHFEDGSRLLVAGALFLRNMAFSKFSKTHFAVWEPVLSEILAMLCRLVRIRGTGTSATNQLLTANHMSTALVCLVIDNQRAQSILQASRDAMTLLRESIQGWKQLVRTTSDKEQALLADSVCVNLDRVHQLVAGDAAASQP